ncbi:MAG: hypothetical protein DRO95_02035 [Candidatus Altiarchaeales archaeon]|nr:MAG: hypothetical protein DRO95_02035 [Candidatus Altiarchaeales archaeon]HDO82293.1 hypothetical protein [Candidatus Altiarchaeales archaeon]HEX54942.1 hypothetical protein [Candidatus Altiarchaeales archaeon]
MKKTELTPIDRLIVRVIKSNKKPMSTYRISKKAKLSWSTINSHCYKLMSFGILDSRIVKTKFGQKKIFWKLKE